LAESLFSWTEFLKRKANWSPKPKILLFLSFAFSPTGRPFFFSCFCFSLLLLTSHNKKTFSLTDFEREFSNMTFFFSLFFLAVVLVGLPHLGFFRACEGVPLNIYSSYFVEYCCIFFVDFGHINFFSSRIYKEEECLYVLLQWKGLNQEDFESCFWKKSFIQNKWKKSAAAEMYAIGAIYWF